MIETQKQLEIRQATMSLLGLGGLLKDDCSISHIEMLLAISTLLKARENDQEQCVELDFPLAILSEYMWLPHQLGLKLNKYSGALELWDAGFHFSNTPTWQCVLDDLEKVEFLEGDETLDQCFKFTGMVAGINKQIHLPT